MATAPVASRAAGLKALEIFVPGAGAAYARQRNFDYGPDDRSNVSCLSPYLRHRLVTESEVVRAVLSKHRISAAEKFIQEVCWRTYWKGWLEQRPVIWYRYCDERDALQAEWQASDAMSKRLAAAETGETGIDCFDVWARELIETGTLHNHARMWFASIWIFTLNLPWQLGADFFYRHLLDGDPASNTLSWRWVAGLQTAGKHYLARADNIKEFTGGRFDPTGALNEVADPLAADLVPEPRKLRPVLSIPQGEGVVLLIPEDDLSPESWPVERDSVRGVAAMPVAGGSIGLTPLVIEFRDAALDDALQRSAEYFQCETLALPANTSQVLAAFAVACGVEKIAIAEVATGPARTALDDLVGGLSGTGLSVVELRRTWDGAFWPFARRGYFALKERIPEALEKLELL